MLKKISIIFLCVLYPLISGKKNNWQDTKKIAAFAETIQAKDLLKTPLIIHRNYPEKIPHKDKRKNLRDEWLNAATQIAKKTGDKESQDILLFIKNHSALAAPHQLGVIFIETSKVQADNWFALIPLIASDKDFPIWQGYLNADFGAAFFQPDNRLLILKETEQFSKTWQGILFLHEGSHAFTFLNAPYNWKNGETYCFYEMKTHNFQNRIASIIGGEEYKELLEEEVIRIANELDEKNPIAVKSRLSNPKYNDGLNEIFKKAKSKREDDLRQTSFWIHGYFVFCDRNFSIMEAEMQKIFLLKNLYKKSGMIQ